MVLSSHELVIAKAYAGRPGGISGYPRAWYRSVSWGWAPPSTYSYKFVGTFSCAQTDSRKARERELAARDEKSTSSGIAEPYTRQNLNARTGGKGRHLWPRLVQKLEGRSGRKKKKKKVMFVHSHVFTGQAPFIRSGKVVAGLSRSYVCR